MPPCPRCKKNTVTGDHFCTFCGAPLLESVPGTPRAAPSPQVSPPPSIPVPSPEQPVRSPAPLKTGIALSPVKVLGIIGILLLLAVAAFLVISGFPLSAGSTGNGTAPGGAGFLPVIGGCPENLTSCSGTCVDLETDAGNCGACGFVAPYGETCINGKFSGPSGVQVRTPVSPTPSPTGTTTTTVSAGIPATTAVPAASCASGRVVCSGTCSDLQTDARNCGSCGYRCPSGYTCQNGWCLEPGAYVKGASTIAVGAIPTESPCEHGDILCGSSCSDLFTDEKNCGVCGRTCGKLEICVNARCGPACAKSGETLCGEECVDLDTDMSNCGACGTECDTSLSNAKGSLCAGGECIISQCKTDYANCDDRIANGCEVYLGTDRNNCGSCGNTCSSGEVCYNRHCTVPASS